MAFYGVRAATVSMQHRGLHFSTAIEIVFCAWSVRRLYNEIPYRTDFREPRPYFNVTSSGDSLVRKHQL
jgi:hypothetical protein